MNKAELLKAGGLVAPEPVKRTVVWKDDEGAEHTFTVTVLPRTAGSVFRAREMGREGKSREDHIIYLATFIRLGENGDEAFTYEEADALKISLFEALMHALLDVHGKPKEAPKNLRPPKKSSANSSLQA